MTAGAILREPSVKGSLVRYGHFMPEDAVSLDNMGSALDAMGGGLSHESAGEKPGMHKTDTIDVIHVVSGQVYAITMRLGGTVASHG